MKDKFFKTKEETINVISMICGFLLSHFCYSCDPKWCVPNLVTGSMCEGAAVQVGMWPRHLIDLGLNPSSFLTSYVILAK